MLPLPSLAAHLSASTIARLAKQAPVPDGERFQGAQQQRRRGCRARQAARSGVLRGRAGCADVRGRVKLHRKVGVHLRQPQQRCCHLGTAVQSYQLCKLTQEASTILVITFT